MRETNTHSNEYTLYMAMKERIQEEGYPLIYGKYQS